MKKNIIFITSLLGAGAIFCAQKQPTVVPIECSDGPVYVDEETLEKFEFFAGLAESRGFTLSDPDLKLSPLDMPGFILSVSVNEHNEAREPNYQFCMSCTKGVMQLLVDYIENPQAQGLQQKLNALSWQELASLLKIIDQLYLKEPYLTHLQKLLIPIVTNPEFIKLFPFKKAVQDCIQTCDNLHWENVFNDTFIAFTAGQVISGGVRGAGIQDYDHRPFATAMSPNGLYKASETGGPLEIDISKSNGKSIDQFSIKYTKRPNQKSYESDDVEHMSFSPDGTFLVIHTRSNSVQVVDVMKKAIVFCKFFIDTDTDLVKNCSVSLNGTVAISFAFSDKILIFSIQKGRLLHTMKVTRPSTIALSFDGNCIAIASGPDQVAIIDITTSKVVLSLNRVGGTVRNLAFSPDGNLLAIGFDNDTVRIINIKKGDHFGKLLCTIKDIDSDGSFFFTSDGNFLAVGESYFSFQKYDLVHSILIQALQMHNPRVKYHQLSQYIKDLLFTLPKDLRNSLVRDMPQEPLKEFKYEDQFNVSNA